MSIRLSEDEIWAELEKAHTGIYTSLRRDGWPISLPTWFGTMDRRIYFSTPGRTKKVARIRHDPRGTFLVERGERWVELCAVMVPVQATLLEPGDEWDAAVTTINEKYSPFRTSMSKAPDATRKAYTGMVVVRLEPAGKILTWDNSRIPMGDTG